MNQYKIWKRIVLLSRTNKLFPFLCNEQMAENIASEIQGELQNLHIKSSISVHVLSYHACYVTDHLDYFPKIPKCTN